MELNQLRLLGAMTTGLRNLRESLNGGKTTACLCGRPECAIKRAFNKGIEVRLMATHVGEPDLTAFRLYTVNGFVDLDPKEVLKGDFQSERFTVVDDDGVRFTGEVSVGRAEDTPHKTPFIIEPEMLRRLEVMLKDEAPAAEEPAKEPQPVATGPEAGSPTRALYEMYKHFTAEHPFAKGDVVMYREGFTDYRTLLSPGQECVVMETLSGSPVPSETGEPQDLVLMYLDSDQDVIFTRANSARFKLAPTEHQFNVEGN
jgi:hypothetical protein